MQHHLLFPWITRIKILQLNINTKHRQSFSWKAVMVTQVIDCVSTRVPEKEKTEKKVLRLRIRVRVRVSAHFYTYTIQTDPFETKKAADHSCLGKCYLSCYIIKQVFALNESLHYLYMYDIFQTILRKMHMQIRRERLQKFLFLARKLLMSFFHIISNTLDDWN